MPEGWTRLCLLCATTLASSHTPPLQHSCSSRVSLAAACEASDPSVAPEHALAPLALPCAVLLFSHMPTLLLPSRRRVRRLASAAKRAAANCAALLCVAAVYARVSPSLAYALSLHLAATLLSSRESDALLLVTPGVHAAARYLASAALVAGAAYSGPPLPVFDAPGVPGCCGAGAHLAAWAAAETAAAAGLAVWLDWGVGWD